MIDPFIARLRIPHANNPDWILDTNFSEAARGYITRITVGPANLTGHITASPQAFNAVGQNWPAPTASYSPSHDLATDADVERRSAASAPMQPIFRTTRASMPSPSSVPRARASVRCGRWDWAIKVDFGVFTVHHQGKAKFLTFFQLYANWGEWFDRAYGIGAASVRAAALVHGSALDATVSRVHDYDLDNQKPVSARIEEIRQEIKAIHDRIKACLKKKERAAARMKNQQALAQYNRGQNSIIAEAKIDLAPYRLLYPALVQAVTTAPEEDEAEPQVPAQNVQAAQPAAPVVT